MGVRMTAIVYFERREIPGVNAFQCERLSATLSVPSCADMWRKANHQNVERHARCKTCPVGAVHAGETAASMSPFMGACICARCTQPAARLIGKHLCVSCYNRQREYLIGKNSRGTAPAKMRPLARRAVRYLVDGEMRTLTMDLTADTTELIVAILRDSKKSVQFSFNGMPRGINQARLF